MYCQRTLKIKVNLICVLSSMPELILVSVLRSVKKDFYTTFPWTELLVSDQNYLFSLYEW